MHIQERHRPKRNRMAYPESTEERLFEFLKAKAMLQTGVGLYVEGFKYTHFPVAQEYVNSRLLIDLLTVFDHGLDEFARNHSLELKKDKIQTLVELGHIEDNRAKYILWYKEWRNDVAHRSRLIQYHELDQPTSDIQKQLFAWKLTGRIWNIFHYYKKISDAHYQIGAIVGNIPILVYDVKYSEHKGNPAHSVGKSIELGLPQFLAVEDISLSPPSPKK